MPSVAKTPDVLTKTSNIFFGGGGGIQCRLAANCQRNLTLMCITFLRIAASYSLREGLTMGYSDTDSGLSLEAGSRRNSPSTSAFLPATF